MRIAKKNQSAATNALMVWLSDCRNRMVTNQPLVSDPYFEVQFPPEHVTGALSEMDSYIWSEIINAGTSHAPWQEAVSNGRKLKKEDLVPPRFLQLSYESQLAIIQGCYRVLNPFRATEEEIAEEEQADALKADMERAYAAERAQNLANDPHYYDYEYTYC